MRANRGTNTHSNSYCHTYSHSDANSDTDSYGDDNSKPEPDRDGHVYTNGGTEIYTNTSTTPDSAATPDSLNSPVCSCVLITLPAES